MSIFSRRSTDPAEPAYSKTLAISIPSTTLPRRALASQRVPARNAPSAVEFDAPRGFTAAATIVNIESKSEAERFKARTQGPSSSWQSEAWEYYDSIGEIKYAFNLVASVISRIRLYVGVVVEPSEQPSPLANVTTIDEQLAASAQRALDRLSSAFGGQAGLLAGAALNLSVTGECYLVQIPARLGSNLPESWDIRSTDELRVDTRGQYTISARRDVKPTATDPGHSPILIPPTAFVGRMWKPHARFSEEADSSMHGILDLCSELLLLNRTFRATAHSRLNAGAMYVPDGLSAAAAPTVDYPYDDDQIQAGAITQDEAQDDFEEQLMEAMTTPIKEEDSAAAVVPLIIRGPADLGDKIKLFKFERSFDEAMVARAQVVLDRIMQGIDVPKDVVTGLAQVKYSNALQIDESLYKAHIEPLMLLIADALTVMYFRPSLIASGFTDEQVHNLCIWYDPSQVATRNDRATDADAGFEKFVISNATWRRAHGFTEADAPTDEELAQRMVIERGLLSPDLTQAVISAIAPDLMAKAHAAQQAASVAPVPSSLTQALSDPITPAVEAPPASADSSDAPPETSPSAISDAIDAAVPTAESAQ